MKNKKFFLILGIIIIAISLIALIGLHFKDKLLNETDNIETTQDVYDFIVNCEKKPFLDCQELLKRELKGDYN